jgi:Domain of unknown function (DUF397)
MTTPRWRKSSRSGAQGGDCVETARLSDDIGIRDSKNTRQGHIVVSREEFGGLLRQIKDGAFRLS